MEEDENVPGPSGQAHSVCPSGHVQPIGPSFYQHCMLHHIVAQPPTDEAMQVKTIRRLLKQGVDLFHLNSDNNPPLHHAVANYHGQLKAIKYLLKKGAGQVVLNGDELTLLQVVNFSRPSYRLCKFLFKIGCSIHIIRGPFPLQKAVESENISTKTVKLLIEKGARASSQTLMKAVQNPTIKPEIIKLLLAHGAMVNSHDDFGYTPLHYAISNTNMNPEIVYILLDAGASTNASTTEREFTALHLLARQHRQCRVVTRMLLAYESNVNATCSMGRTPLMYASKKNDGFDTVKMLLQSGTNLSIIDDDGFNALHHALTGFSPNGKIVKLLIEFGVDISRKANGLTPYEWFLDGSPEKFTVGVFAVFLNYGVDVHYKNSDNKSALYSLLEQCPENVDVIVFLLNNGAWRTNNDLPWQVTFKSIAENRQGAYPKGLETVMKYAVLHQVYKYGAHFMLYGPNECVAIKSRCVYECFSMRRTELPHGNLLNMLLTQKFCTCNKCNDEILRYMSHHGSGAMYFDTLLRIIPTKFLLERLQNLYVCTVRNDQIIVLNRDCVRMLGKYLDKIQLYMSNLAFPCANIKGAR